MRTESNDQKKKKLTGLRLAVRSNSVFSLVAGLIYIQSSKRLSDWMGIENGFILIGMGIGLLFWAYFLFRESKKEISKKIAQLIIAGGTIWGVVSILIILGSIENLSTSWLVAVQADIAIGFAIWQLFVLQKQNKS